MNKTIFSYDNNGNGDDKDDDDVDDDKENDDDDDVDVRGGDSIFQWLTAYKNTPKDA